MLKLGIGIDKTQKRITTSAIIFATTQWQLQTQQWQLITTTWD
jgi:hypothetical protein